MAGAGRSDRAKQAALVRDVGVQRASNPPIEAPDIVAAIEALEAKIDTMIGHVDALEAKGDATNTKLDTLAGHVDGLEARIDTSNTHLAQIATNTTP